ncbi:hypothetical protein L9F63_009759, partial [Diploptera punctata]
ARFYTVIQVTFGLPFFNPLAIVFVAHNPIFTLLILLHVFFFLLTGFLLPSTGVILEPNEPPGSVFFCPSTE